MTSTVDRVGPVAPSNTAVPAEPLAEPPAEPRPDGRSRRPQLRRPRPAGRGRRPAPPLSRAAVVGLWFVVTVSFMGVFFLISATLISGFQHDRSNALLYAQLREGISQATIPTGGFVSPGTPIAVMSIPAIGLHDQVVVEGSDSQQTSRAIGHRRDTPFPGQFGASLLYGRSFAYGGVFSDIGTLRPGQKIEVTTAQGAFTYEVERIRHSGDPLPSALDATGSRLTLSTASGSPLGSTSVVLVDAKIVGTAVPGPSGRPSTVAEAEKALGTNTRSLVLLVFWLQGFLLSAVIATWAGIRWGGWQTWMVAAPVLLGTLWEATQQVLLLLPNLV